MCVHARDEALVILEPDRARDAPQVLEQSLDPCRTQCVRARVSRANGARLRPHPFLNNWSRVNRHKLLERSSHHTMRRLRVLALLLAPWTRSGAFVAPSHRSRATRLRATVAIVGDCHDQWDAADGAALEALGPDLVLFVGDFGNENVDVVRAVSALRLPKAAILGNHDAWFSVFRNRKRIAERTPRAAEPSGTSART